MVKPTTWAIDLVGLDDSTPHDGFLVAILDHFHAAPCGNANSASDSGFIVMLYPGAVGGM